MLALLLSLFRPLQFEPLHLLRELHDDETGADFMSVVVFAIIVVVLGGLVLLLLQAFLPDIWAAITQAVFNLFP